MIFNLRKEYAPEAYSNSREFRIFLEELGMLASVFKYDIDHIPDLYNPDTCPTHMLPLLASLVGYKYDSTKSVKGNRLIIKNYPYLLRNRGSEYGLKLAVALSLNANALSNIESYSTDQIVITVDVESGTIFIYYPESGIIDWNLINAVRPVGMNIILLGSNFGRTHETLQVKPTASYTHHPGSEDYPKIGNNPVTGFTVVDKTVRPVPTEEVEE